MAQDSQPDECFQRGGFPIKYTYQYRPKQIDRFQKKGNAVYHQAHLQKVPLV